MISLIDMGVSNRAVASITLAPGVRPDTRPLKDEEIPRVGDTLLAIFPDIPVHGDFLVAPTGWTIEWRILDGRMVLHGWRVLTSASWDWPTFTTHRPINWGPWVLLRVQPDTSAPPVQPDPVHVHFGTPWYAGFNADPTKQRVFDIRPGTLRNYVGPLAARPDWEQYALLLAQAASSRSQDPVHKVGSVVLRPDHSVAGVGYNGAPSGVEIDFDDVEGRKPLVIHAETNALRYVDPAQVRGGILATTRHPCASCLTQIAAYGIRKVIVGEHVWMRVGDDRDWTTLNRVVASLGIERTWLG